MSTINFSNGKSVTFNGTPTQADVEALVKMHPELDSAPEKKKSGGVLSFLGNEVTGGADLSQSSTPAQIAGGIFQNTVGSKGLLSAPKAIASAISSGQNAQVQTDLAQTQQGMSTSQNTLLQMIQSEQSPVRKAYLQNIFNQNQGIQQEGNQAQQNIDQRTSTPQEAAAGAGQNALNAVSMGIPLSKVPALGKGALSPIVKNALKVAPQAGLQSANSSFGEGNKATTVAMDGIKGTILGGLTSGAFGLGAGTAKSAFSGARYLASVPSGLVNIQKELFEAGKTPNQVLTDAAKGKIKGRDIVETTRAGVNILEAQKNTEYNQAKKGLTGTLQTSNLVDRFQKHTDEVLGTNIFSKNPFGDSVIQGDEQSQKLIKKVLLQVSEKSKAGELSANDYNNFRESIQSSIDAAPLGSKVRVALGNFKKDLRSELSNINGFDEMQQGYTDNSKLLSEIKKTLSISPKDPNYNPQTILNKVITAFRPNQDMKRELLDTIQKNSGKDIQSMILGQQTSSMRPQGSVGTGIQGGIIFQVLNQVTGGNGQEALNQAFKTASAGTLVGSPKIMGKVLRASGRASSLLDKSNVQVGLQKLIPQIVNKSINR